MFYYRRCPDNTIRIWNPNWANDQFEVFTPEEFINLQEEFTKLQKLFARLSIVLREAVED